MIKNTIPKTECTGIEKSKVHTVAAIVDYNPDTVACTTIIKKITGDISAVSFNAGRRLTEKVLPFDIFILLIEGKATITINGIPNKVAAGQCIVVSANAQLVIQANGRFKMVRTIIRSGYEQ